MGQSLTSLPLDHIKAFAFQALDDHAQIDLLYCSALWDRHDSSGGGEHAGHDNILKPNIPHHLKQLGIFAAKGMNRTAEIDPLVPHPNSPLYQAVFR